MQQPIAVKEQCHPVMDAQTHTNVINESGFMTLANTADDLHKDIHRVMGVKQRHWLFHWDDIGGGRKMVTIRSPHLSGASVVQSPLPKVGDRVEFEVRLHAVRRGGRREFPLKATEVGAWMQPRMKGFCLVGVRSVAACAIPKNKEFNFNGFLVHGSALIDDADAAFQTLTEGIGRSRGYGFGMLMISKEA
jgi:hypothetical protein